jgi:ATP-dependent exoDNAse (exonuclease V) beta subunit
MQALYMILAPSRPSEKTVPKTLAGIVRAALCDGATAAPDAVLYEHGVPDWQQYPMKQTAIDGPQVENEVSEEPEELTIQLRPSGARRGRGLERVRPSRATGPLVQRRDWLRPWSAQTLARGVLLHAWLEHIEWLDDGEPEEALLRRVAYRYTTGGLDVNAELLTFRRLLDVPQTRSVLSRCGYGNPAALGFSTACCAELQHADVALQVLREWPFAMREDDTIVHGIIDRLVLFCQGKRVIAADILDFKSEVIAISDTVEIDAAVTRYQSQLALYQRAMARQYALDADRITTRLLFVQCGIVQSVTV